MILIGVPHTAHRDAWFGLLVVLSLDLRVNFFGAKFGRDVIYYDIDQLDLSARKMILSSISMDLEKRKTHNYRCEFHYGPEGKKRNFLGFSWDGKKPWKNRKKAKKKILRFSFF